MKKKINSNIYIDQRDKILFRNEQDIILNSTDTDFKKLNSNKIFVKKPLTISIDKNMKKKLPTNILHTDIKLYRPAQIRKKFYPQINNLISPKNKNNKKEFEPLTEIPKLNYINRHLDNILQKLNKEKDVYKHGKHNESDSLSNLIQVKKHIAGYNNTKENNYSISQTNKKYQKNKTIYNYTKKKIVDQGRFNNTINKLKINIGEESYNYGKSFINNENYLKTEITNNKDNNNSPDTTYTKTESNSEVFNKIKLKDNFLLFPQKKEEKKINSIKLFSNEIIKNEVLKTNPINTEINIEKEDDNDEYNKKTQSLNENKNKKDKKRYIYINRKIRSNKKYIKILDNNKYNKNIVKKQNKFKFPENKIQISVDNNNSTKTHPIKNNKYSFAQKEEVLISTPNTTRNSFTNKIIYNHIKNKSSLINKKSLQSFKFLVHKANEIEELGDSFNKLFLSGPNSSRNIKFNINNNKIKQKNNLAKSYNFRINTLSDNENSNNNSKTSINKTLILEDKKPLKENNYSFNDNDDKKEINYKDKIVNNNTFNTTVNFYKINEFPSDRNKKLTKLNNISILKRHNQTQIEDKKPNSNYISYSSLFENLFYNKPRRSKSLLESDNSLSNQEANTLIKQEKHCKKFEIDLEILYVLEAKLKSILNKINNYNICFHECFDWITYYFSSNFYEKEINLFKYNHNKNNIIYYIKVELLCYFLCYDVSFNKNFNQAGILLKTIFNLLHINYLILISFIIHDNDKNQEEYSDNLYLNRLNEIISKELKINLTSQDMNENSILVLISNNFKEINNYYKMIIDNLYSYYYSININNKNFNKSLTKFPNCLSLDVNTLTTVQKLNIVSIFFFDTYRLLNNYNFEDLKNFFELYLYKSIENEALMHFNNVIIIDKDKKEIINNKSNTLFNYNFYENNNLIKYNNTNFINNKNFINENKTNNKIINEFYLPPIKSYYKYTLVLDLDETLIYFQRENNLPNKNLIIKNNLIFRPGLLDFLHKMKYLYELVLFSFGTKEYVQHILNIIEKKEKFFEYALYRQHATYEKGDFVKNLALLGRDLRKIIIVDDIPHVFKLQKSNGICIKAFYGDVVGERNTLKLLGKILEKIRFDADENGGDIRKSLKKQRNIIFTHITTNLEY